MSNKKIILIVIIILIITAGIILAFYFLRNCPEGTVSIEKLAPQNNQNQVNTFTPLKIFFDGEVGNKEISFDIKPKTEMKASFAKKNNGTIVTLTSINNDLDYNTEYIVSVKSNSRCSKIKDLYQGSFTWQFKTATKEYLIRQQDKFEEELNMKNPLMRYLPYETSDFKIIFLEDIGIYRITLMATLNNADQIDLYKQQLKQYKQEALQWIKSKGTDPAKLNIEWKPQSDPDNPKI